MFSSLWPWAVIGVGLVALTVLAVRSAQMRTILLLAQFGGDLSAELLHGIHTSTTTLPPAKRAEAVASIARRQEVLHTYMRIGISLLVVSSALFVVLPQSYADAEQKWAFGSIGTVLGYWLKK